MEIKDLGRYAPAKTVDQRLESLETRTAHIEQLLVRMHAEMTPKWVRAGGWTAVVGGVLGTLLKVWME